MITKPGEIITPDVLVANLIAPCGMNCGLCSAHFRDKNRCPGCNGDDSGKPNYCVQCPIKLCAQSAGSKSSFCHTCEKYPCPRLRRLDKRYRSKYGMSMVENLDNIRLNGLDAFLQSQRERWTCPDCGGVICVHKDYCLFCGRINHE